MQFIKTPSTERSEALANFCIVTILTALVVFAWIVCTMYYDRFRRGLGGIIASLVMFTLVPGIVVLVRLQS